MNRIYFVRHGENYANLTKEFSYKKIDYPLTKKGILQAEQTAEFFARMDIDEIYSSPLLRARQTAEIIGIRLNLPVVVTENFREVNVGALEGMPDLMQAWAINARVSTQWMEGNLEAAFPNGENFLQVRQRMMEGLEQVMAGRTGLNIVIVCHGGILSATIRDICPGADRAALKDGRTHNCSITEVLFEEIRASATGKLVSYASFGHLSGPAADLVSGVLEVDEEPVAGEAAPDGD
ncbi:MAG: histidine phosphatase family protein [Rudaea sp.]